MDTTARPCEIVSCDKPAALRVHLAWEMSDGSDTREVYRDLCADDALAKHDDFTRPGDLFQVAAIYDKETPIP